MEDGGRGWRKGEEAGVGRRRKGKEGGKGKEGRQGEGEDIRKGGRERKGVANRLLCPPLSHMPVLTHARTDTLIPSHSHSGVGPSVVRRKK